MHDVIIERYSIQFEDMYLLDCADGLKCVKKVLSKTGFQSPLIYYLEAINVETDTILTASTSSQTTDEISSNTPRKVKQKQVIKVQKQKIRRMKSALGKAPKGKEARQEKALEEALEKLPANLANFVRMQIKLHARKEKKREKVLTRDKVIGHINIPRQREGLSSAVKVVHITVKINSSSIYFKNAEYPRYFSNVLKNNREEGYQNETPREGMHFVHG